MHCLAVYIRAQKKNLMRNGNLYVRKGETVKELNSLIVKCVMDVALHDKLQFKGHFAQDDFCMAITSREEKYVYITIRDKHIS